MITRDRKLKRWAKKGQTGIKPQATVTNRRRADIENKFLVSIMHSDATWRRTARSISQALIKSRATKVTKPRGRKDKKLTDQPSASVRGWSATKTPFEVLLRSKYGGSWSIWRRKTAGTASCYFDLGSNPRPRPRGLFAAHAQVTDADLLQ
jgi:hypothetical protein